MAERFTELMDITFWGNTVLEYLVSAGIVALGLLAVTVVRKILLGRLRARAARSGKAVDDLVVRGAAACCTALYLGVFYVAAKNLAMGPSVAKGVDAAGIILLTLLGIRFGIKALSFGLENYWAKRGEELPARQTLMKLFPVLKVVIWAVGVLFLLDNLGFKISTVVAGLGVGGIAVALAAQAVLGDLFSYFSILLDRPFEEGDFIIEGDYLGTIEHIGIKTTRIRSLGGEQIVFSNTDLTNARIRNYKRMESRRVVFRLGVVYQTRAENLREIPGIIREIINSIEHTKFDRAHFSSFGDFSLVFEVVYYVLSSDYNLYMDIQQEINLRTGEEFEKRGIEFAYPTQTVFISPTGGEPKAPPA